MNKEQHDNRGAAQNHSILDGNKAGENRRLIVVFVVKGIKR